MTFAVGVRRFGVRRFRSAADRSAASQSCTQFAKTVTVWSVANQPSVDQSVAYQPSAERSALDLIGQNSLWRFCAVDRRFGDSVCGGSVCGADWSAALRRIGVRAMSLRCLFTLSLQTASSRLLAFCLRHFLPAFSSHRLFPHSLHTLALGHLSGRSLRIISSRPISHHLFTVSLSRRIFARSAISGNEC